MLDVLRLCHVVPATFLRDSWAGTLTVFGLVTLLLVCGNVHYRHKVRQPLELTTTKPLQRPLKIIMLSDLHLGYHNRCAELHRWVELLNSEKADLILMAGDLIDRSVRPLIDDGMDRELLRLNAPVVACLGNHICKINDHILILVLVGSIQYSSVTINSVLCRSIAQFTGNDLITAIFKIRIGI